MGLAATSPEHPRFASASRVTNRPCEGRLKMAMLASALVQSKDACLGSRARRFAVRIKGRAKALNNRWKCLLVFNGVPSANLFAFL